MAGTPLHKKSYDVDLMWSLDAMFGYMDNMLNNDEQAPQGQISNDNGSPTAALVAVARSRAWGADIAQRLVADGAGGDTAADLARMVDG